MEIPLVEFRNVVKQFGDNRVLDGINLQIYENQITTIIGKSGTGKSVLLKHIIGLLKPDSGTILFRGTPIERMKKSEWDQYRSRVSYMFQNNALFDSMTVYENVALPLRQTTTLDKKEIGKRVMTRIEQTDLADVVDKYPSELSGGMQKRVALARALVTDPAIVLFDEPTTGQDPIRKNAILSMVAHYRKKFGFTAVLISHDIPDVIFISDRIVLLWEGKVGFQGPYDQSTTMDHPMMDEFMKSLEGFQDELTGLLSKEMFKNRYAMMLGKAKSRGIGCAIYFGIDVENLEEHLGANYSLEVLRLLGEHTNRYFDPLGGFSARLDRGSILTILPHTTLSEGKEIVSAFSKYVEKEILPSVESFAVEAPEGVTCVHIELYAGMAELSAESDISTTIEKSSSARQVVASYQCPAGGENA